MTTAVAQTRPTDGMIHVRNLHPAQREIFQSTARFRVVSAGRRFGKTRLGVILSYCKAATGYRVWWVGPTFRVTSIAWRSLRQTARLFPGADVSESARQVTFPGGGWIQVKSADNPESLRGDGLDLVIMDEAAYMSEAAWQESIRPALSDFQGHVLFISTPAGHNWFWKLYNGAGEPGQTDWARWQFPTSANPFIRATEIETARLSLPERIFQQEYLADFIADGAGVFRHIEASATATPQTAPIAGHEYAFGVDWAKSEDWTVITVVDLETRELVAIDRFNQIDYPLQIGRVKALADLFKPFTVIAECNGVGDPLVSELAKVEIPVQPFLTSNASKNRVIEELSIAMQNGSFRILSDPVLLAELQAFEATRLSGGLTKYSAPAGMHDDCVMSLAFAYQAIRA